MTLSYEEVLSRLDDMAERFPPEFFGELTGGILLHPEEPLPADDPDLFTMGAYCHDSLGRRIELYYRSFAVLASEEDWTQEDWEEELWITLSHEFTHHMESLAGERGLEIKDELFMEEYRAEQLPLHAPPAKKKFSFFPKKAPTEKG